MSTEFLKYSSDANDVSRNELRESSKIGSIHLSCIGIGGHSGNTCEGLIEVGNLLLKRDKYGSGQKWRESRELSQCLQRAL
jgi:hypothetical protein